MGIGEDVGLNLNNLKFQWSGTKTRRMLLRGWMNTSRDSPAINGTRTSLASTQQQQLQQQQQQQLNQQQRNIAQHQNHQPPLQKGPTHPVISHQPSPLSYLTAGSNLSIETSCKVNSTATTIELEQPCGISSFLPIGMSCRDRAEAFARRLQSRLRTLGVQDNEIPQDDQDTVDSVDSTWINGQNGAQVTNLQPLRLLTNETADSYFDFDIEPESPGSPIDECEYTRLIETTSTKSDEETVTTEKTHQDAAPESGFVCASPCSTLESGDSHASASSSEVHFFDPEISETDINQSISGSEYYDCQEFAKSIQSSNATVDIPIKSPINLETASISTTLSSTSSSSSTSKQNGHLKMFDDSSESLPPSQSTELTNSLSSNSTISKSSNSNSTLQDTDAVNESNEVVAELEQNKQDDQEPEGKMKNAKYETAKTKFIKYNEAEDEEEDEETNKLNNQEEQEEEEETKADEEVVLEDEIEIEEIEITEMPDSNDLNNLPIENSTDMACNSLYSPDNDALEYSETQIPEVNVESEDNECERTENEEYDRPQRVRRCSSLKTGKTPPGTPGRKKIVRFADVLGLDLADVRTFLDEVPKVPKSAFEDLEITSSSLPSLHIGPPLDKVLVPMFQQPGALPGFLDKVRDKQVCLENAAVTDPISLTITGTVRVRNLDFHKSVHIRYSLDHWRSYSDLTANYVENSCDGFSDKFSFILFGNSLQIGQRIEMAIRFQAKGEQFWDNNYGANYCFHCLPCNTQRALQQAPKVVAPPQPVAQPKAADNSGGISLRQGGGHREWSNAFLY